MDTPAAPTSVGAVVALKPTQFAKSRLGNVADPLRRRIAWTMAVDTLTALSGAVAEILVVSDQPSLEWRLRRLGLSVRVVAEPGRVGMNGALSFGAGMLAANGHLSLLACVGDLPALRSDSVRRVLAASREFPRSFLADASGVGTTMLLAHRADLDPRFQGRSAAAHKASGAVPLRPETDGATVADARRDVDTDIDLSDAYHLGLGAATDALFDPETHRLGRYDVVTVTGEGDPQQDRAVITSGGYRLALPWAAVQDSLLTVHPGQRLHAVTAKDRVLTAWL
jgi:2-phospho-L-lactate guanylyltransferase